MDYNEKALRADQVLQYFEKNVGLLERVFGEQGIVMYDIEYERVRNKLKYVYGYLDVDDLYPSRLDEEKLRSILDILFRVPQLQPEQERQKILGIF